MRGASSVLAVAKVQTAIESIASVARFNYDNEKVRGAAAEVYPVQTVLVVAVVVPTSSAKNQFVER